MSTAPSLDSVLSNSFQILPVNHEDIPALATISSDSFENDANTELKSHGKEPFDLRRYWLKTMPGLLTNPRVRFIKAADSHSGDIMGFCIWGFRGLDLPPTSITSENLATEKKENLNNANEQQKTESADEPNRDLDSIARLEKLTDDDLKGWVSSVMTKGVVCLYVIALSVSPAFQKRGVGSALLGWGTDVVDSHAEQNAFAWVHSSAGAWHMYEKAGFKVVRTLDIDLDEYAPVSAPADRYEGGKWGRYVFRYMVYGRVEIGK